MLGARLSGLREAERVLSRLEIVERLAFEMQKIFRASSTSSTTTTTAAATTTAKTSSAMSTSQFLPHWSLNPNMNSLPAIPATPPLMQKPILVKTRMTRS